ncbi:hypothetical protein LR68_03727 [Anoxybacillus sp. BCO1]|nr:hypothetical protein LR68_03727 [Anoxybacillus sp. BCO1]
MKTESYTPISPKLNENEQFFKDAIGVGTSFDLGVRKLNILKTDVHLYYCNGLCDTQYIIELLEMLVQVNDRERQSAKLPEIIENRLVHQQVNPVKSLDEAVDFLLTGLILLFIDGETKAFAVDVRSYPGRSPEEPDTEKVVRGRVMAMLKILSSIRRSRVDAFEMNGFALK